MICKKCGRENPRESAICANCGEALTGSATLYPGTGSSLDYGWRVVWRHFWGLFFTVFVYHIFAVGIILGSWLVYYSFTHRIFNFNIALKRFDAERLPWEFNVVTLAIGAFISVPLLFGILSLFLGTARGEKLKLGRVLDGFRNYPGVILVGILYESIFGGVLLLLNWLMVDMAPLGLFLLVVWTVVFIVIMCRLVFVPFLITDRKMKGFGSVKSSWSLSEGHAGQAFGIGVVAVLVGIGIWLISLLLKNVFDLESGTGGYIRLSVVLVLEILTFMWFTSAFTSLYYAVSVVEKETGPENRPALTS